MTVIYWMLYNAGANSPGFSPSFEEDIFSANERGRLEQMRFALRRNSFMLGRQAVKNLLQRCCAELERVEYNRISIENDPSGAPYVQVDGKQLPGCVTISHSGNRALCAYTAKQIRIGADLEEIQTRANNFLLDYFTSVEIAEAESCIPERQPLWITAAWSAKEAVLKALRSGLRMDTRQIEVSFPDLNQLPLGSGEWLPFIVHKVPGTEYSWSGWWQVDGNQVLTLVQGRPDLLEKSPEIKRIPA